MNARVPREPFPRVVKGAVRTQRRRCGKSNCHCVDGQHLHESSVLSYWDGSSNRTLMLAAEDVAGVQAAVARYNQAQRKLETQANAGIAALQRRLLTRRGR